ncbi:Mg2+-importing ATPase [Enterococcus rotai]|uniref:magnesium-translocating P-type ATPase n=1 Tax=Enterococcus rotai TaxID=118060 RepID=UPI0033966C6F
MQKEMKNMIHEKAYQKLANLSIDKVLESFSSSWDGLRAREVQRSKEQFGVNKITDDKKKSIVYTVIKSYITPFTVVLMILATISFFTEYVYAEPSEKDIAGVLIMLVMVLLSGTMTLVQSVKSSNAVNKLQNMIQITATVTRENKEMEIPMDQVVCGDLVKLSAGDMIPADLRLIHAKDLFVSQSAMTGESFPVEKKVKNFVSTNNNQTDFENLLFLGSNVVSGSGVGVAVRVGDNTLFGKIAQDVADDEKKTSFELGVNKTTWLLIRFMMVITPAVFLINGITKGNWSEALMFAIATAVGLTPEMLPMIVTTNLVKGSRDMAKEGTIMKNINAIQNFGAMDILCTDKTGTLTQDKVILEYHYNTSCQEDREVLHSAFLNSYFQTGLRNLIDKAIIEATSKELSIDEEDYFKIDEIPFDFNRRRMSVVIKNRRSNQSFLITKGAVEEMLQSCSHINQHGEIVPITPQIKKQVLKTVNELNKDGLRVLAIADKQVNNQLDDYSVEDEKELILQGYLAFLDPPKETAAAAIKALENNGVSVKILTGDNELVTRSVCKEVGLGAEKMINGSALAKLSETELEETVNEYNIFTKVTPDQKTKIVKALKKNEQTVGFMGDGINDAGAMKVSDVGISVDTAVDIAKESADVILLQKDLMVLEKGIISGRRVFSNTMKYIKMTASSNFGNVFSVIPASIFLPFLPVAPIQSLFLNLIYDTSCMSVPWDNVDAEYVEKPKKWEAKSIGSFMKWFGPTSSIFDIVTYLFMYFIICPAILGGGFFSLTADKQLLFIAIFHAGWFIESLWSQMLVLHVLRTPKIPFLQSRASGILTLVTSIGILVGTILPFTGLGASIGFAPLPGNYFYYLIPTIVTYLFLVTVIKKIYMRKYQELL